MIAKYLSGALTLCALAVGCGKDASPGPRGEMPPTVNVAGATVVAGVAKGKLRQGIAVPGFRIARHPITVGQYRECVDKGACAPPASTAAECKEAVGPAPVDGATYDKGDPTLPVTCVTVAQAKAFCSWVGGDLPRAGQWMLAARGRDVARYAWGDEAPTCERHAGAGGCTSPVFSVGAHKAGAAHGGVEDALLGRAEMIAAEGDAPFNACAAPHAACVAYGAGAGAIDAFEPIGKDDEGSSRASTFRCVFKESP